MTIQIYNTLTRKKSLSSRLEEGKVKMYVCGPTVYNYIHIGNARPVIVFDTVRRYLEYRGYDVNMFRISQMLTIKLSKRLMNLAKRSVS